HRFGVSVEQFDDVEMRRAIHGIAADADAGGLADAATGELPDCFISKCATARDYADIAALVDVAGSDADAAATVRILARAGCHDTGTIRPDEPCLAAQHGAFDLYHVVHRNAFGD